jgi:hypothetical protein
MDASSSLKSILLEAPVSADPAGYLRKASGKKFWGMKRLAVAADSKLAAVADGGGEGGLCADGEPGEGRWKPSCLI